MNFARIDTRKASDIGAKWHVDFEGTPLYEGEGKERQPIQMFVLGLESEVGRKALAAQVKERTKKTPADIDAMSIDDLMEMADTDTDKRAEFFAKLVTGWDNITYIDDDKMSDPDAVGRVLEFSYDNAVMLLKTRPWIMKGLDRFLGNSKNFAQVSVTN